MTALEQLYEALAARGVEVYPQGGSRLPEGASKALTKASRAYDDAFWLNEGIERRAAQADAALALAALLRSRADAL